MRILYIARYRNATMERKIKLMAQYTDVEIWLLRPSYWKDTYIAKKLPVLANTNYNTLAVPLIGKPTDPHRTIYGTLSFHLRRIQPHLVHAEEEPDSLAALQIATAHRILAPRALLVLHTWQNINRPKAKFVWWVTRKTLDSADAILGTTAEAIQILRELGYKGVTAAIPQEGVNLEVFRPRPEAPPSEPFVMCYAGRLAPEKDIDLLLRTLKRLPSEANLMLIGEGPHRESLENLANELGLADRVKFVGAAMPADMPALLHQSGALVLPSRTTPKWKEQFGRVLIEAMACGIPVVGSDSGAIPEVIGDAGLVFPERDARALAHCLKRLIESPILRQQLSQRGVARVTHLYSQEHIAAQTVHFYRHLLEITGRPYD